jgi:hypothetical protein
MLFKRKEKFEGVTLVETLIYIGLFGIIFTLVMQFLLTISENTHTTQLRLEMSRYKTYSFQHLEKTFLDSELVDMANSTFGNDNGELTLIDTEGGGTLALKYEIVDDKVIFTRGVNSPVSLTPNNITVTQFYLEEVQNVDLETIGINITLSFENKDSDNINSNISHMYKLR